MVSVDGGSFLMGDSYNEGLNTERPAHNVFVSAFWIDRFEVSKAMWDRVTSWAITNGYVFQNTGAGQANNHPVQMLNWYDIVKWCNARSEMDGLLPVYFTDSAQTSIYRNAQIDLTSDAVAWDRNGYRLPTEAEWEKAARGGLKGHHFPWPSYGGAYSAFIDGTKANFVSSGDPFESGTTPYTTPVGYYNGSQSPAGIDMGNGFGLYDMAGNLWEY